MMPDLQTIPTGELVQIVKQRRTRIERAVGRSGCLLSILLAAAVWVGIYHFTAGELFVTLSFFWLFGAAAVSMLVFSAVGYLRDFRLRKHVRELNRRFGRLPVRSYVRQYARRAAPSELVCLFHGTALPYGNRLWGSVWVRENGNRAVGRTISWEAWWEPRPNPWDHLEFSEYEVSESKASEICALINRTKGTGKTHVEVAVLDGFPATVAVVFGDGSKTTVFSTNLCSSVEKEQDDRIKLLGLVASVIGDEGRTPL
jgi:hypothetical protein